MGLYRLDSEGKILSANSTLAKILGFSSSEELRSKSFFDYHFEPNPFSTWQQQLKYDATEEFEGQIYRRDRTLIWIRHNATAVKDTQGNLVGYEGAVADITPSKQAQLERIHLLNRERQAREKAETINRIKDEFLATLSHELRTPLNAIVGWVQLLQIGNMDKSKMTKALKVIDRNAKAQNQLIDDLLDVSRIIRGSMKLELQPAELTEIIGDCIDTVKPTAEAKNITIVTQIDSEAIWVKADRDRLQQVFWNLLINAVKFTPAEGTVTISSEFEQNVVRIKIEDTGQGISLDVLPYIFDRFRQAETKSSTRTQGGLGLGLAIVRHLVELHGGKVTAQSQGVGTGATFIVELALFNKSD